MLIKFDEQISSGECPAASPHLGAAAFCVQVHHCELKEVAAIAMGLKLGLHTTSFFASTHIVFCEIPCKSLNRR